MINQTEAIIERTQEWLQKFVLDLKLCPFANQPFAQKRIRYIVAEDSDPVVVMNQLMEELNFLKMREAEEVETTLFILPEGFEDFLYYLDFLEMAEGLLEQVELTGILQIASFHPDYQFANTKVDAPENFTNRSPYPILHLLREDSISEALTIYSEPELIPERNIATMNRLGNTLLRKMYDDLSGKN